MQAIPDRLPFDVLLGFLAVDIRNHNRFLVGVVSELHKATGNGSPLDGNKTENVLRDESQIEDVRHKRHNVSWLRHCSARSVEA